MKSVYHLFMPGQTVVGALKKYNNYKLSSADVQHLLKSFREINPHLTVIRPGTRVSIPLIDTSPEQNKAP